MNVKIELDKAAISKLSKAYINAALGTAEQVIADLHNEQTMPHKGGTMENDSTFVKTNGVAVSGGERKISVSVVTDSPQARRLYYHPEYNFTKKPNENAGGEWLEPYINGDKKDFVKDTFANILKEEGII